MGEAGAANGPLARGVAEVGVAAHNVPPSPGSHDA
jgi:hypothetical protein